MTLTLQPVNQSNSKKWYPFLAAHSLRFSIISGNYAPFRSAIISGPRERKRGPRNRFLINRPFLSHRHTGDRSAIEMRKLTWLRQAISPPLSEYGTEGEALHTVLSGVNLRAIYINPESRAPLRNVTVLYGSCP